MKFILSLMLSLTFVFSLELTPLQMQMAQNAGFSKADIEKKLSQVENQPSQNQVEGQEVKNDIQEMDTNKNSTPNSVNKKSSLKRYGESFFKNKNKLNPYSIPTPNNYILTHGDSISLNIYGSQNETFDLKIDNNGNVTIPLIGELKIMGYEFKDAKELISKEVKKAYPNLTNIMINISEFSTIQVTVSGLVNAPGLYNLTTFSTIKDALSVSGGILSNGSYRSIQVKREGKVIKNFDLYKLIKYGKDTQDITLKNGDIILVNPIDIQVKFDGEVNNKAIYELKSNENYKNLLDLASGLKPTANTKSIILKRYENNQISVKNYDLKEFYKLAPKDGDEIIVSKLSLQNANLVKLNGNIIYEGDYEIPSDNKLSTLLKDQLYIYGKDGFFKKSTRYELAFIENIKGEIKGFNLEDILNSKVEIYLNPGDIIKIQKEENQKYFFVEGKVVDSSKKEYVYTKGLKAKDLYNIVLFKFEENINGNRKIIYPDVKFQVNRYVQSGKKSFMVDSSKNPDFEILAYDEIKFFSYDQVNIINAAVIKGEVFIPGRYNITNDTTIREFISTAGGFTNKALKTVCELSRYEVIDNQRVRKIYNIDLNKAYEQNLKIYPDDEWTIFQIENWYESKYIEIKGQVKYPGKYAIAEGEKLASVIQRAGGFTKNAFLEGSIFTRAEVKELQQKRLDEALNRVKQKATQINASATQAGEKLEDKKNILSTLNQLESQASKNQPIGRVTLDLYHDINRFKQSNFNITLKDKDVLYIPSVNDTVSVVGEVLNQNTFIYDEDLNVQDYISKAGGVSDIADEGYIYIVKANGEAQRIQKSYLWGNSNDIFKGDTIIIPMRLDTVSDVTLAKDITSIVYQLAITAASLKTVGGI